MDFQFFTRCSAVRHASACMVSVGLRAPLVPNTDPPSIPRLALHARSPSCRRRWSRDCRPCACRRRRASISAGPNRLALDHLNGARRAEPLLHFVLRVSGGARLVFLGTAGDAASPDRPADLSPRDPDPDRCSRRESCWSGDTREVQRPAFSCMNAFHFEPHCGRAAERAHGSRPRWDASP